MGTRAQVILTCIMMFAITTARSHERVEVLDTVVLKPVRVTDDRMSGFLITRMDDVGNGVISAAKKTELVKLENLTVNTTTNNARQVFSSIVGINVWESDALGLQLGIGGRGLSPNRTSNFTTRQNGYDIAADPLGYPESYYTPPMDLLDRIEVTRGGAALRYGTQFGGVVNFVTKAPSRVDPFTLHANIGGGSYGLLAGSLCVTGSTNGVSGLGFYQYRKSDGWREHSAADQQTAYGMVTADLASTVRLVLDYTHMDYLAQQPGGLSDKMFADDPERSIRARNWFKVNWNVASARLDVLIDSLTTARTLFSAMLSSRTALGNLDRITMVDLGGPRTMIHGEFLNLFNETTITRDVPLFGHTSTVAAGFRIFSGRTLQQQGNASAANDADFTFTNPDSLEGSDYTFPNHNIAAFAEGVVRLGNGFSLVPGLRVERINTQANGWYRILVNDLAGNHVVDTVVHENRSRNRAIVLGGLGFSWKDTSGIEVFGNVVQNYRAITFTDLRVVNPNLVVDPNIQDERGYTVDVGCRGTVANLLAFDASLFYLRYNNKIGELLKTDVPPLYVPYRYRTNVADAYTAGIEAVVELDVTECLQLRARDYQAPSLYLFVNASVMDGRYASTADATIANKRVELVPPYVVRTGLRCSWNEWSAMCMGSWVGEQFTDATNSQYSATAVSGLVPAYSVVDASVAYKHQWFGLRASVNNLLDARYFTRRAVSYPGPGIIPSEPLTVVLSLSVDVD